MRWFLLRTLALWIIFIAIIGVVIGIGRQQPIPAHIAIYKLTDCKLPCWIGLIPGKSTIREARQQIRNVYGDTKKYALGEDGPARFFVEDKVDLFRLAITLNHDDYDKTHLSDDSPVTQIALWMPDDVKVNSMGVYDSNLTGTINAIGSPTYVAPDLSVLHLIYQTLSIDVAISYPECMDIAHNPFTIDIFASLPEKAAWLDDGEQIHAWRGFRACYRFDQP